VSFEETIRQIIREENDRHLEQIRLLLKEQGFQDKPRLLTVEEAAKILKMGKSTVYELTHRINFPVIRDGRKVRIPYAALMNWIEQGIEIDQVV
jgi:excisionase family DNA binding protein